MQEKAKCYAKMENGITVFRSATIHQPELILMVNKFYQSALKDNKFYFVCTQFSPNSFQSCAKFSSDTK